MLNHSGTQTIETERLTLRQYRLSDAEDMFNNWVTDAEVTRFWGWSPHRDISETKALLLKWIGEYTLPTTYHWVIVLKDSNQAVGYLYLNAIDDINRSSAIHFLISRKYWNLGIATEACKAVIDYAFSEIGMKIINTHHHIDNPASGKVMQKAGMKLIKEEHRQFPAGDESMNGIYRYYTITARD